MSIRHGRPAVVPRRPSFAIAERVGASPARKPRRLHTGALMGGGVAVLAFGSAAIVGRMISSGATRGFDHRCRHRALRRRTKPLEKAARLFSTVGEPAAQLSLAVLATLDFARRSQGHRPLPTARNLGALSAAGAPIFSSLVGIAAHRAIKLVFKRSRPLGALMHGKTESSFPSGHTAVTTATSFTIAYALKTRGVRSAYVVPTAILLSGCVGLSRILLDEHWATDVIGGWCVGIGIASGTTTLASSFAGLPMRAISRATVRAKVRDASLAR
jgi:membrane-associated phospholipid phosphatase